MEHVEPWEHIAVEQVTVSWDPLSVSLAFSQPFHCQNGWGNQQNKTSTQKGLMMYRKKKVKNVFLMVPIACHIAALKYLQTLSAFFHKPYYFTGVQGDR